MKKALLGSVALATLAIGPAIAADIPRRAPVVTTVAAPVYNWSGFYVGAHGGYGWGNVDATTTSATLFFPSGFPLASSSVNGGLGGLQGGFNVQYGAWVFGVEGNYSWADLTGSETTASPLVAGAASTVNHSYKWVADVSGRVGYAWNNWMLYAKGGWAWTHSDGNFNIVGAGGVTLATGSAGEDRSGYLVGGGFEYGFTPNWSAKVEYNYMDFGTKSITHTSPIGVVTTRDQKLTLNVIKAGLNYRFNWVR
jgi:outer membrane immunogenic protein